MVVPTPGEREKRELRITGILGSSFADYASLEEPPFSFLPEAYRRQLENPANGVAPSAEAFRFSISRSGCLFRCERRRVLRTKLQSQYFFALAQAPVVRAAMSSPEPAHPGSFRSTPADGRLSPG